MKSMWDERYGEPELAYGSRANDFLSEMADSLPPGPVLCLAEGQGRNAVFLAKRGHRVTAVDQSRVGLARAKALAAAHGVQIDAHTADLEKFVITPGAWAGIVAIFAHLPPALRTRVHRAAVAGLQPGGVFILEAYTPAQLDYRTGGPRDPDLLMTLEILRQELAGLEFVHARETIREIHEGRYHTGRGVVVQVMACKPPPASLP
jgi:SAM-dependent methyltransferase